MDDLVAHGIAHANGAAVDARARRGRPDGRYVTAAASDMPDRCVTRIDLSMERSAGWRLGRAHEVGEPDHVDTVIFGIRHRIERRWESDRPAEGSVLLRQDRRGDAH